jgi:hypothetical protein
MKDVEIIGMLKTYISQTLVGMGALKGANCRIKSIVKSGDLNTVTFIWTDTDGTSKESTMLVLDGTSGIDGVSPTIVVKESTDTKYILTITDATGSFDTPNLKGGGGSGGASALSELTDVQLTSLAAGNALIYNDTAEKWVNMALAAVATSGSYDDLSDKPTIPDAQIQSDWAQSDNTKKDFIKNKPTLGAAAAKASTDTVTEDSTALVESGGVFTAIENARGDVTEAQYSAIASILS